MTTTTMSLPCWNGDHDQARCARSLEAGTTCDCTCHQATDPTTTAPQPATPGDIRETVAYLVFRAVDIGDTSRAAALETADEILRHVQAAPTVYALPPEPPESVTAVKDRHGCTWGRDLAPGHWILLEQADAGEGRCWHIVVPCLVPWRTLLAEFGDVTAIPSATTEEETNA